MTALLLVCLLSPSLAQDAPPVEEEVPALQAGEGLIPSGALSDELDSPAAPATQAKPHRAPDSGDDDRTQTLLLSLVALLLLWLLARGPSAKEAKGQQRRRMRRSPMTHEELGRAVFEVARGADFRGYRDLYLNGPEAGRLLGPDRASAYLRQRSDEVLEDALAELAALIPEGAIFDGVKPVKGGMLGLRARSPGLKGPVAVIAVGTVTESGGVQRLVYPPPLFEDEQRINAAQRAR